MINSTKSPDPGAGKVTQPRLPQVWRVHEVVCAHINVFKHSEKWRCQYSSDYVVAAIMWLKQEDRQVCETGDEGCRAKRRGICGCILLPSVKTLPPNLLDTDWTVNNTLSRTHPSCQVENRMSVEVEISIALTNHCTGGAHTHTHTPYIIKQNTYCS
jgi:hypothetical protein